MYKLPSLVKTAYYACDKAERKKFDLLEAPDVNLRDCCESLFEILKIDKNLNEGNDRQTMFSRSQFRVNDQMRFRHLCIKAALYRHIECLKFAHEIGVPWYSIGWDVRTACDMAAESGNLDCLRYAHENGCTWDTMTCSSAAGNGHLECLIYARENGCPWDRFTCSQAAYNGHMDCLSYALENGCPRGSDINLWMYYEDSDEDYY